MKRGFVAGAVLLALVAGYYLVQAGNLEPPGAPAPTMVTLEEISSHSVVDKLGEMNLGQFCVSTIVRLFESVTIVV